MATKDNRPTPPTLKELRDYEKNGQETFHSIIEAGMVREFSRATKRFYLRPKEATEGSVILDAEGREIGRWT